MLAPLRRARCNEGMIAFERLDCAEPRLTVLEFTEGWRNQSIVLAQFEGAQFSLVGLSRRRGNAGPAQFAPSHPRSHRRRNGGKERCPVGAFSVTIQWTSC